MANFHKPSSPYINTPVKDFYLDLWVPPVVEAQEDDQAVIIAPSHHERPDKLAYAVYGTPNLFWVFWARNKDILIDPINDFTSGTRIMVPSADYISRAVIN